MLQDCLWYKNVTFVFGNLQHMCAPGLFSLWLINVCSGKLQTFHSIRNFNVAVFDSVGLNLMDRSK